MAGNKRDALAASLPSMMYGFGDVEQPDAKSVELVESLVVEHIQDILRAGMEKAEWQGMESMDDLCIMVSVRNDPKRYAKLQHLLKTNVEVKEVKGDGKKEIEKWREAGAPNKTN